MVPDSLEDMRARYQHAKAKYLAAKDRGWRLAWQGLMINQLNKIRAAWKSLEEAAL